MNEWKSCGTSETDYNTQQIEPLPHFLCIGYEKVYNLVPIGASNSSISISDSSCLKLCCKFVYKVKWISMSLMREGIKSGQ